MKSTSLPRNEESKKSQSPPSLMNSELVNLYREALLQAGITDSQAKVLVGFISTDYRIPWVDKNKEAVGYNALRRNTWGSYRVYPKNPDKSILKILCKCVEDVTSLTHVKDFLSCLVSLASLFKKYEFDPKDLQWKSWFRGDFDDWDWFLRELRTRRVSISDLRGPYRETVQVWLPPLLKSLDVAGVSLLSWCQCYNDIDRPDGSQTNLITFLASQGTEVIPLLRLMASKGMKQDLSISVIQDYLSRGVSAQTLFQVVSSLGHFDRTWDPQNAGRFFIDSVFTEIKKRRISVGLAVEILSALKKRVDSGWTQLRHFEAFLKHNRGKKGIPDFIRRKRSFPWTNP